MELLSRYRNFTALLLVLFAQLILLAYQVRTNQDVRLIRIWAVTAVTPPAKLAESVRSRVVYVLRNYILLRNLMEENHALKEELGKLKIENQYLNSELALAERARSLSVFQSRSRSRTLAARVIGTGTAAHSKVVFVDRGSGSGVMRGMAVVTPEGIVGKVIAAYPTASQVLLITDPSFAAGVISQKNRVRGTIKGQGHTSCIVDYVQNEEKVEPGEAFYTSGDDRIFPRGLPVGTVSVVREGRTYKEIFVVPSGIQNGIEEVLIVLEGVHEVLPENAAAAPGMHLMPPPPPEQDNGGASEPGATGTDADKLREHYLSIGAAQNHKFGEGLPGSKPPNFNLDPAQAKPAVNPSSTPAQPGSPAPATAKVPAPASSTPQAAKPAASGATPKP